MLWGLQLSLTPRSCLTPEPSSQCKVARAAFPACRTALLAGPCSVCGTRLLANLSKLFQSTTSAPCACRGALLADQDVLLRWQTPSPLLIMGSHTWNTPNERGELKCGGPRQEQILEAARHRCSVREQALRPDRRRCSDGAELRQLNLQAAAAVHNDAWVIVTRRTHLGSDADRYSHLSDDSIWS